MTVAKGTQPQVSWRATVFRALRWTLVPTAIRAALQRRRVTIITYHAPSPAVFEAHIKALKRVYNLVPLADYVEANRKGDTSHLPSRALIITIDDGHRSNYALKDVVMKHRVPVTIFVCSGLVETRRRFWFLHEATQGMVQQLKRVPDAERVEILRRAGFEETKEFDERQALSGRELLELKANIDLQSHTVLHPILPRCSSERAETEISQSKKDLERLLESDVYAFAYPNGDYSERDVRFVERAGYKCAVSLDSGFNSETTPRFKLRRICIPDDASCDELMVKASGFWQGIQAALGALGR